jgi:hypothetical protein
VRDVIDGVVAEALRSMGPRPGYGAELLNALRGTPALPVLVEEESRSWQTRWIVPGTCAGVIGAAGIVAYGLGRRHNKRRAG